MKRNPSIVLCMFLVALHQQSYCEIVQELLTLPVFVNFLQDIDSFQKFHKHLEIMPNFLNELTAILKDTNNEKLDY